MNPLLVPAIGIALTAAVVGGSMSREARASAKARRAAQGTEDAAAADTARETADALAERQRQEEQAAADRQRARLLRRVDRFGLRDFLQSLLLRHPWAARAGTINVRRAAIEDTIAEATIEHEGCVAEVKANPIGSNKPLSIGAAALWFPMTLMLLYLDWELLTRQGLNDSLSTVLAAGLTLVIEVLGVVAWSALGVHTVDLLAASRRWVRIAVAMLAAVAVATLLSAVMLPLAVSRAEEIYGEDLRSAQSTLAAAEADGNPVAVETARKVVDELQDQFDRSRLMNQGLTAGLALGVVLLSWAPFAVADHRRAQQAKDRLKDARKARQAIDAEQAQFDADFTDYAAGVLDDLDLNPNDVRMLLTVGEIPNAALPDAPNAAGLQGGPDAGEPASAEPPAGFPPPLPPASAAVEDFGRPPHGSFTDDLPNPFDLFPQGGAK